MLLIEKWLVNKGLSGCIIITNKSGWILTLQLTLSSANTRTHPDGYNNRYYVGEERRVQ